MKTNVTDTSIQAYHAHPVKSGQALEVALYCQHETKAGRPVWIGKIADHFALQGRKDLNQTGRVSARLNDIKERGAILNGLKYRLEMVRKERPPGGRTAVEMWALVLDLPRENAQLNLF